MSVLASELNAQQSATLLPELGDGFYSAERNGLDVQVRIFGDKYYVVGNGYFWGPKMRNAAKVNQKTFLFERFKIQGALRASTEEAYNLAIDTLTDVVAKEQFIPMYKDVIESSKAVEVQGSSLNEHKTKVLAMKSNVDFEISGINAVRSKAFAKAKKQVNELVRENVQIVFGAKSTVSKTSRTKEKTIFDLKLDELEAEFQAGKISASIYPLIRSTIEGKLREEQKRAERKAAKGAENKTTDDETTTLASSLPTNMQVDLNEPEETPETVDFEVEANKWKSAFGSEVVDETDEKGEPIGFGEIAEPVKTSVTINNGKGSKNTAAITAAKQRKAKKEAVTA